MVLLFCGLDFVKILRFREDFEFLGCVKCLFFFSLYWIIFGFFFSIVSGVFSACICSVVVEEGSWL